MTATAEAKERKTRAAKTCHLEIKTYGKVKVDEWAVVDNDQGAVIFAGETEAKKYVIDNGLIGTFRCVWTGQEFVAAETKKVSIK